MLNLGLRYNYATPLHESNNQLGSFNPSLGLVQQGQPSVGATLIHPDRTNFSPRLGVAWDVTGKGTTVIRAGGGVFYSVLVLANTVANPAIANVPGGVSLGAVPTGGLHDKPAYREPLPADLWRQHSNGHSHDPRLRAQLERCCVSEGRRILLHRRQPVQHRRR